MIINLMNQADLFREIGGATICEIETKKSDLARKSSISEYHRQYRETLIKLVLELRQIAIAEKLMIQAIPPEIMRKLLYKYFPDQVEENLDFIHDLAFKNFSYGKTKRAAEVAVLVEKWLACED